jgi:hypothetical protein
MLKLRHRHRPPEPRLVSERPLSLVGSPSFVLQPRPQDDGAMWPALVARCRRALPAGLQWAAPLLDIQHPLPVLCGETQVRAFFRWLDGLPNTERVSIGCQRRAGDAPSDDGPGGAGSHPRNKEGIQKGGADGLA